MIAIVGSVGVPACYGGFETLVENLLGKEDRPVLVYCSGKTYDHRPRHYKNARLIYLPLQANGVQSIPYDIWSIVDAARRGATDILVLGVSGSIAIPLVKRFKKINFVTNIDGLEWRRQKWGKLARGYLKFAEKIAVSCSQIVVADNQAIADYVSTEYGVTSEVIAYGGDHALVGKMPGEIPGEASGEKSDGLDADEAGYGFALCRIEPENNVQMILEAFADGPCRLKFIGNWDNSDYGQQLKQQYGGCSNIEIIDPVYDLKALFRLRNGCCFYVHGHSAGGTNPSLVEMMHFAKPIYCFDCDYNRATTENGARYFATANALATLLAVEQGDAGSRQMGQTMQQIASRRYTWDIVKAQYFNLLG